MPSGLILRASVSRYRTATSLQCLCVQAMITLDTVKNLLGKASGTRLSLRAGGLADDTFLHSYEWSSHNSQVLLSEGAFRKMSSGLEER